MKVGVILSESSFIPSLAKGMFYSLKHGVAESLCSSIEWVVEFSNYNTDVVELKKILQKMIVLDQVDLVCMPINPCIIKELEPLFEDNAVPLIVLSSGDERLYQGTPSNHILINSFSEQESCWMIAKQAVEQGYRKITIFCSIYESGYSLYSTFNQGLQAAGGDISRIFMTHQKARDQDVSSELLQASKDKPDCIMGFYSSKEAISFLSHFDEGRYSGIPLIANSAMLTPEVIRKTGNASLNVESVSCWYTEAPTKENKDFVSNFTNKCNRKPDRYSLLAYETGLILGKVTSNNDHPKPLIQQLAVQQITGPRGIVNLSHTGQGNGALHHLKVVQDESGQCKISGNQLLNIDKTSILSDTATRQGWLNPYLIT